MPPSPKANINSSILVWARKSSGYSEIDAATKLAIDLERLKGWETGEEKPTIKQLRRIGDLYKRPISVFYLHKEPADFQVMRDLRRLPGAGIRRFTPEFAYEMRLAQQRRELALELLRDVGQRPRKFTLQATLKESAESVGIRIREALDVTYAEQARWGEPRVGFKAWRERIERFGVLVFQFTRVEAEEASGFALAEDTLPVVAVNRKDVFSRRGFSLLHEFAHLMLRVSGASDLDVDARRPPEDARVEIFCNQVAAAALMPKDDFLREPLLAERKVEFVEWTDAEIEALAGPYSVSREAVVRRLMTFGFASAELYGAKRTQYAAERAARKRADREKNADKEFRTNPARDAVLNNGRAFVRLVLDNYHQDRITLRDVSGYLDVRVRHIPKVEVALGPG